jgi:adenylate cyclase
MSVFEFLGHTLDLKSRRLKNGAGDVMLRPKSLTLLTYLVRNPGRVIAKDELIEAVWPDVVVSDDSLSQCVKDIRNSLGPQAEGFIRTVPRRGYILDERQLRSVPVHEHPKPHRGRGEKPSIAVLPFEAGGGPEWFATGIAEDITTALAKNRGLRVISKNYSFALKGSALGEEEIAQQLGVEYLLEGSVRLLGDKVRVSTRLLEGETGELLWGERFDRELADIFAVQDEITDQVVRHLELELLPEERRAIRETRTQNIEAYHYELRGRQLLLELTKPYLVLARRMFVKAADLDPGYARAYAGQVMCDCFLREFHDEKISPEAILRTADRALGLDPLLSEAYAARGFALFCGERYDEAELAYQRALSLDPNSYDANFFSAQTMARFLGDTTRVVETFKLTTRLRPEDYYSPMIIASVLAPRDPERSKWAAICFDRAERAAAQHPESAAPLHRGALALAYLGEREKAHAWLARALAIDPDDFATLYNAACIHSVIGELDQALDYLEKALRGVSPNAIKQVRNEADFDPIREHPRYLQLLLTLG